jgi:hypothetical protein
VNEIISIKGTIMTEQEILQLASLLEKAKQALTSPSGCLPEFIYVEKGKGEIKGYTPYIANGGQTFFSLSEEGEVIKVESAIY